MLSAEPMACWVRVKHDFKNRDMGERHSNTCDPAPELLYVSACSDTSAIPAERLVPKPCNSAMNDGIGGEGPMGRLGNRRVWSEGAPSMLRPLTNLEEGVWQALT